MARKSKLSANQRQEVVLMLLRRVKSLRWPGDLDSEVYYNTTAPLELGDPTAVAVLGTEETPARIV